VPKNKGGVKRKATTRTPRGEGEGSWFFVDRLIESRQNYDVPPTHAQSQTEPGQYGHHVRAGGF